MPLIFRLDAIKSGWYKARQSSCLDLQQVEDLSFAELKLQDTY